MAFVDAAAGFEDEGLRGVKAGEIGGAAGWFMKTDAQNRLGLVEKLPRLVEIGAGLFPSQIDALGPDRVHHQIGESRGRSEAKFRCPIPALRGTEAADPPITA
jgi:hypothetical protein